MRVGAASLPWILLVLSEQGPIVLFALGAGWFAVVLAAGSAAARLEWWVRSVRERRP